MDVEYKKFTGVRIAKDNLAEMRKFIEELPDNNDSLIFTSNTDEKGVLHIQAIWNQQLHRVTPSSDKYFGFETIKDIPSRKSTETKGTNADS